MRIRKEDEYNYLAKKSIPYALGWQACAKSKDALSARREVKLVDRLEFDQGYSDCYANGESESVAFDYVAGI
jgi:hypothetical protein